MVVIYITGRTPFDVAVDKMAETNNIEKPEMPVVLEHAFANKELGITIGTAAALVLAARKMTIHDVAGELSWRVRDLVLLLRKTIKQDRLDALLTGVEVVDVGLDETELWSFFRQAGMRYTLVDSVDPQRIGLVKAHGQGDWDAVQPPGIVLMTMELFGTPVFKRTKIPWNLS